ncbi:MAG: ubiquinone/menaquinone biosynthesis C-methylase UbiE [Planctomycetota bacterium]|jgi:ubiquinone/menaquinone biosynthesis C-methylase UbiE
MKLTSDVIERNCDESDIYNEVLSLNNKHILELGCGGAEITRAIASNGHERYITALEVDQRQHKKNLALTGLPNVTFQLGGAEAIPVENESQDIVFLFKSLHHVPEDKLDQAMEEIHRVLTPGGMVYISEPIFAGNFNDIIRLFHDEQHVRNAAFNAIQKSVKKVLFTLVDQLFFNVTVSFESFSDFEDKILNVTHTDLQLTEEIHREVKLRFEQQLIDSGAHFTAPMRVDLLQKSLG